MKRLSLQLCNFERRMRKEAAENLQKEIRLQAELKETASKKIKVDDDSAKTFYKMDSLPSTMFFLGEDKFLSIAFFLHVCIFGGMLLMMKDFFIRQETVFLFPLLCGTHFSRNVTISLDSFSL